MVFLCVIIIPFCEFYDLYTCLFMLYLKTASLQNGDNELKHECGVDCFDFAICPLRKALVEPRNEIS